MFVFVFVFVIVFVKLPVFRVTPSLTRSPPSLLLKCESWDAAREVLLIHNPGFEGELNSIITRVVDIIINIKLFFFSTLIHTTSKAFDR